MVNIFNLKTHLNKGSQQNRFRLLEFEDFDAMMVQKKILKGVFKKYLKPLK